MTQYFVVYSYDPQAGDYGSWIREETYPTEPQAIAHEKWLRRDLQKKKKPDFTHLVRTTGSPANSIPLKLYPAAYIEWCYQAAQHADSSVTLPWTQEDLIGLVRFGYQDDAVVDALIDTNALALPELLEKAALLCWMRDVSPTDCPEAKLLRTVLEFKRETGTIYPASR